ncbi:hypothetical protein [Mycolicibacterium phlei]|uniref:hypothetical protein n=1 Tax=Mycolicibacterium phlei TaxID=1771 RepID=UPI0037C817A4
MTVRAPEAPRRRLGETAWMSLGMAVAITAGGLAVVLGPLAAALVLTLAVLAAVAWRPVLAPLIYLATLPILAGVDRGAWIPLLRPNEAVLAVLILGVLAGIAIRYVRDGLPPLRLTRWDLPVAAFFLIAIGWPACSMLIRGLTPSADDLAALLPAAKLAALLFLTHLTVRTASEVRWCIKVIVGGAVAVAVLAVLQVLGIEPVAGFLHTYYPVYPVDVHRATTTLSNSVATGDYLLIGAVLLITAGLRGMFSPRGRLACLVILAAGLVAAGQFSTWLGMLIAGAVLLRHNPSLRALAVRALPVLLIAMLAGAPALADRFGEFGGDKGAPLSWMVRWANLTDLYMPPLFEHGGFLLGVAPNSVLVPPDAWRDVVYLESGYLQLLWMGGIPLLAAFVWMFCGVLDAANRARSDVGATGACAAALVTMWWVVLVLSLLDPHLYLRGPGDVLAVLIAITLNGVKGGRVHGHSA